MPNGNIATELNLFIPNTTLVSIGREKKTNKFIQTWSKGIKKMDSCSLEYVYDLVKRMNDKQDKKELMFSAQRVAVSFAKGYAEVMLINGRSQTPMRITRTGLSQLLTESRSAWSIGDLQKKLVRQAKRADGLKVLSLALSLDFKACLDKNLHFRTCLTRTEEGVQRIIYGVTSTKYTPFDAPEMLETLHEAGFGGYSLQNFSISREGVITAFSRIPITEKELNVQVPCLRVGGGFVKNRAVWIAAYLYKLWCTNGCGSTQTEREASWTRASSHDTIKDGLESTSTGKMSEAEQGVKAYDKAASILIGDMFSTFSAGIMTDGGVPQKAQDSVFRHLSHETVNKNGSVASFVDVITLAAQKEPQTTQLLLESLAWDTLSEFNTKEKVLAYATAKKEEA